MPRKTPPRLRAALVAAAAFVGFASPVVAGPAALMQSARIDSARPEIAPIQVGWICDMGEVCRDNDTGALRTRDQIKGNSHVLDPEYAPAPVVRSPPRHTETPRWNGDDRRYRERRYDDRRYRDRYRDSGIYLGIERAPSYRYVEPRRTYRVNRTEAHISWCYDRWRSYRDWDNTYQPTRGPRKQCVSPYG